MTATLSQCIEAHRLKERIYDRHLAGCCWHIVLDDDNLDDDSVRFCINYANENDEQHADCIAIGPLLLAMSRTQRKKLISGGYAKANYAAYAGADPEVKP